MGAGGTERRIEPSAGESLSAPTREATAQPLSLTQTQFDALIVGLPWQRLPEMSVITRL